MKLRKFLFGERYLTKVAAVFPNREWAQRAAADVQESAHVTGKQVQVIEPYDSEWERKVEPEGVGIWRTAIRSHVTLGVVGLIAGAFLYFVLWAMPVEAIRSTPWLSFIVISTFGMIFGLMAGGFVTMRPDHDAVVAPIREATKAGRWAVVVHASSQDEEKAIVAALNRTGTPVASTL